jgi:hypothetical protein
VHMQACAELSYALMLQERLRAATRRALLLLTCSCGLHGMTAATPVLLDLQLVAPITCGFSQGSWFLLTTVTICLTRLQHGACLSSHHSS